MFGFGKRIALSCFLCACGTDANDTQGMLDATVVADAGLESEVTVLEQFDVGSFNEDLIEGVPTADLAFYLSDGGPLAWDELAGNITRAKRIFGEVGVQLRVRSALHIQIPADWQQIDPAIIDLPSTPPELRETDLYRHLEELRARPSARAIAIFEAIVAHLPEDPLSIPASNTIHLMSFNEVPIPFYEWNGAEWIYNSVPTGGLSLPPYTYADRMPEGIRGAITLSFEVDRFRPDTRVLAHELGHKLINVSHEGGSVCPSFEANGPELMLYGNGEIIPAGEAGRWHQERLALSPFLYRVEAGQAVFANQFLDGGIYRDRLYEALYIDPPCSAAP